MRQLIFLFLFGCSSGGANDLADLAHVERGFPDLSTGLDPLLSPADGSGEPCMTPGSLSECSGYAVCRWYSTTALVCDPANKNNPGIGVPCNKSSDCDLMYACYRGFCFNFCTLGGTDCGFPDDCVDVGYAASNIGICKN